MTSLFDIRWCPDGSEHDWSEEVEAVAGSGPMEGRWMVAECVSCGVGSLRSLDSPEDSLAALLGKLESLGCDPKAVR